jgi:hypothetical protein
MRRSGFKFGILHEREHGQLLQKWLEKGSSSVKIFILGLDKNKLQPLSAVPGCSGCHTPVLDEVASLADAGYVRWILFNSVLKI